ncbi:hypothetical protein HYDPIDRAFT_23269 [Hydnomerulius pinastri MD-312]|nr:hypothetical protein HYDPIDRAFT_23269 [Hydnomerulius pinastri MD-312]
MVADDDIDVETLQAQIDMSMSVAHNLVTSWIKPAQIAQLRSNSTDATQILEEELRRPPRLGVGAPIPGAPFAVRDASKLKHRLMKNGGKNSSQGETSSSHTPSKSNDEEQKGRSTKRKAKVDPFTLGGSKKRKTISSLVGNSLSTPEVGQKGPRKNAGSEDGAGISKRTKNETSEEQSKSKSSMKKKLLIEPKVRESSEGLPHQPLSFTSPRSVGAPPHVPSPSSPSRTTLSLASTSGLPPKSAAGGQQSNNSPTPVPDQAKQLGFLLLNLDGPPDLPNKLGNASSPNSSRKKRKRRKKKKAQTSTGTGDN